MLIAHCLTRAQQGGGGVEHPSWVFFAQLSGQFFRNFLDNFRAKSPKVRSPGQVKWPHLRKNSQSRHGHSGWEKYLKPSGFGILPSTYNLYISYFISYRWPKVRSISWPPHYKPMGKNSNASNTDQICSTRSEPCSIRLLLMASVKNCICDPRKGHLRSNYDVMSRHVRWFQSRIYDPRRSLD